LAERPPSDTPLALFFYGTLKRGHANHERFCGGYLRIEEATARGRLYELPYGYPALVVPEEDVRAVGTADPVSDVREQRRLGNRCWPPPEGPPVFGELCSFADPAERLPALDRLEGFDPGGGQSLYQRVLLPVETREGTLRLAWTYVVMQEPPGTYLPAGRWPP
jgi:gamma-glutamylcyclotransferase (GGCT)/AIG2-like uncharacterized protein YtfP